MGRLKQFFARLTGQLMLSHILIAIVVLAIALGVARGAIRQYLI